MSASAVSPREDRGEDLISPVTLNQLFYDAAERHDRANALQVKVGGRYQPVSHRTLVERVRNAGLGLRALGIPSGSRIAILSENRPEWAIADYACLTAGFVDVPVYGTLPAEQMLHILEDSGAVAIFVSNAEHARTIASIRPKLASLEWVIGFDATESDGVELTLAALEAKGAAAGGGVDGESRGAAERYRSEAIDVSPDQVATIIYTSGTTGEPKGAMLTHGNIASNVAAVTRAIPFRADDVSLSFLPLSHILERMFDYLMFAVGVSIAYVESMDTIVDNLGEVRPTIVVSVPRIYEKIYARVLDNALSAGGAKKQIFFWARKVGERWADETLAGRRPGPWLAARYAIARKLVFSKLAERVGGRLRYFVSGGAPLATEINKFFYAAGLVILEGYGLTETSPVIAVNTPDRFRLGTVGQPISGVEVRIAEDGEIMVRGPNVMKGYFNRPDDTRAVLESDGWFHTGDIGELDADGYLSITDRKKDIIVTAGGKNIAPQPIENAIKTNKYVTEAVMIGDKRKYPVVLVVPNFDNLEKWATYKNITYSDRADLITQPMVRAKMEREVLGTLHGLANFETPKKVALLSHEFSIERGELTPTLKVKRRAVDRRYREMIDQMYGRE
ncbi:MAG TPA: long-chain fatty acid--CoA ligase [Gemmatimonadaceae bacterium]|nr:long-chain fatty acid--CoA ligase [Gemmatimonadaceae bacterium]